MHLFCALLWTGGILKRCVASVGGLDDPDGLFVGSRTGPRWAPPSDTGLLPLQDVTEVYLFCVSQITRGMARGTLWKRGPDTLKGKAD